MRWRTRHVQVNVSEHLRAGMNSLGWFAVPPTFAEFPIDWAPDHDPETVVANGGPAKPNTVGVSVGDVPDNRTEELGGGLYSIAYPVFIDIYGENRSMAVNIGDDITGILQGELWAPSRYIPLYDRSLNPLGPVLVDQTCEAVQVEARWAGGTEEWRRKWRTVSFTATLYFIGPGND